MAGVCHRCQATLPTNGGQAEDTAAENFAGDELAIPGYRIEELLGSGGFGQVVAAVPGVEKDALPTRVAIKIARRDPPQAAAQLRSEARVLAAIGAPAVPALHDQGVLDDGSPYLVMEHIAGPLLATTLARREAPIAGDEFITLATAITRSVARVHDRGFVHRDLKPENIIIAATPLRAVLLDLGLAMPLAAEPVAQPIDRPERGEDTGPAEGTVEYMAPEQCAGPGPADARSDLYALGVVLFEMATGRPPFFGVAAEVYEAHLSRRPPRPSTLAAVSSAAEAIILRCLAKDPAQRYADAHRVIAALQQAAGDRAPSDLSRPGTQPVPDTANRPGRRRASTARSQEKVAILWLRSRCEVAVVEAVIERRQGQIVHLTTGGYVAVFPPQRDHHPLEMAVAACRELCDREVGERMAIELAPVKVRVRSGGTRRYFSTLFGREDRFPRLSDPPGITVGAAATRAHDPPQLSPRARR
ncbi:MAG: serine/threonine-protein kinase, partial [Myxococcota bacterium]